MNTENVVEVLKTEAQKNPVANAVFHVLAMRQRARNTLTVGGLAQRMKLEGFDFKDSDYVPVLKLLADVGFGTLEINKKGKIEGLKEIKKTLQSIGMVACGNQAPIKNFKPRAKYSDVVIRQGAKPTAAKEEVSDAIVPKGLEFEVGGLNLSLRLSGKSIDLPLPKDLNGKQLGDLIDALNRLKAV